MPEELWTEVHDIVQGAVIKTIPKEKKFKKEQWLSEEALQIAMKRRKVKSKGEKERYTHLNAEFQRKARRDKKAFLSDQCKELEENNRIGKSRDLFDRVTDRKARGLQTEEIACKYQTFLSLTLNPWKESYDQPR